MSEVDADQNKNLTCGFKYVLFDIRLGLLGRGGGIRSTACQASLEWNNDFFFLRMFTSDIY